METSTPEDNISTPNNFVASKKSNIFSITALILTNLIPLYGVIYLNWNVSTILFLYWTESAVIGILNILKILKAAKPIEKNFSINGSPVRNKMSIIYFFIFHFGIFMMVHYAFIISVFKPQIIIRQLVVPVFCLFVSHSISFWLNFLGNKEYLQVSPNQQMLSPYKRIIIMHFTVLFGGYLVQRFYSSIYALVLMIMLKIAIDLYSHFQEHIKFTSSLRLSVGPFSIEQQPEKQQMIDSANNMAEQNMNKYSLSEEQKKKARNILSYLIPKK